MQTRRIDSRIVGRMRRRMDPSVPRGIPLNRGGKSFRSPSRQTRQRREVGKNGGEGLNRARQSPRISPRSISFSCFSFQIFSLLGGFFLCGAGSGIPSFDRNGPSLRIEIENHAEFRVFERHNIIEIIENRGNDDDDDRRTVDISYTMRLCGEFFFFSSYFERLHTSFEHVNLTREEVEG